MGKWTRRGFITAGIVAGGALLVGIGIRPGDRTDELAELSTKEGESLLTAWVKIDADNLVTAIIPHSEMGQGVHTALMAMLAEEMEADWDHLTFMEAPAEKDYANYPLIREFLAGNASVPNFLFDTVNGASLSVAKSMNMQITGGSTSVRFTGVGAMLTAGAAARELLIKAASEQWDLPEAELRAEKSYIHHDKSGKSAQFAEFAQTAATLKPNIRPTLKKRSDYKLIGQSLPRVDLPAKVDGTAMFGIDAKVEGMKYATVKAAPVLGNTVETMNAKLARKMPGVIDVLNMGDYVAVVADGYWQAKQALDQVEVTFTTTASDKLDDAALLKQYNRDLDTAKQKKWHKQGNADAVADKASSVFSANYQVPFLAHACMEPMNATAWIRDGQCEVWTGTQNPLNVKMTVAETLDIEADNVTVHNHFMGGGFGRRADRDYTDQAVLLAQKTGLPIKLIWSREEDMQHDHYRPAAVSRLSAALDNKKMPISWDSLFTHKMDPPEAALCIYDIADQNIRYVESPSHIRFGPWRSVDHTQHGFFTESFIDELADNADKDPYEFRRELLKDKPRHLKVLDEAAKLAGWGKELPKGQAQGIAIADSFMTIVAEVVTVDMSDGTPKVLHVACAADAGIAVNPDGFKAQMESGIIYGLTAAMYGEISIADGAIEQSNFHDYEMVRMDTAPEIDVVIINSDAPIGGAGEPGTPPITPALTNAIFAATGKRIRKLPVMSHEFGDIG